MTRKPGFWIVVSILVLLVGIRVASMGFGGKSDQKLIEESLDEAILASKEGRPGGVMDFLSKDLKVNGESVPRGRDIADYIKKMKPEVEVMNRTAIVSEDTARIETRVKLKIQVFTQKFEQTIENVTITFKRENATKWLIFPDKKWRLFQVEAPNLELPNIGNL